MEQNIYDFIKTEESLFQTTGVPIVDGYEWKFFEHIRLSTLYKNSKFSTGADDGNRPYKNIIRPILNVAYRSEGFDVKDIEPFVNDKDNYYKSFLVRKFHDKWARDNDLDTFIDDLVESYVDFGGVICKNVNNKRPEVVPLQRLAFCDQTDILSGPICEKHQYSVDQLLEFKGKWNDDAIDEAITAARSEKTQQATIAGQKAETPGKYIEVYELHGMFPESWLNENGSDDKYTRQMHIITYTKSAELGKDNKNGVTLYKGKEKDGIYKVLLRDKIYGRALGFGGVEELFEAQVWTNYNEIQIKDMLDIASLMLVQTADKSFANSNKITDMVKGQIVSPKEGMPLTQVQITPINMQMFENKLAEWEQHARTTGSANDPQLGVEPASGTPMGLQQIVVNQGQGIHEYRRGKISTFVSEIYRDWILKYLVDEMNDGDEWMVDLDLEEMQFIAKQISTTAANRKAVDMVIKYFDEKGDAPTQEEIDAFKEVIKKNFMDTGSKHFLEIVKGELNKIPVDVFVNVAGKQKNLDKIITGLTNIFRTVLSAPQLLQDPGIAKLFNEIIEASGFSPVNFQGLQVVKPMQQPQQPSIEQQQPQMAQ
jgi:hypothetical protein